MYLACKVIFKLLITLITRFRLAELQMGRLLRQQSPGDLDDAIETLTSNLDDYYSDLVTRIQTSYSENAKMIMQLLTWLVYAKRDLKVPEVQHALAVHPGNYSAEKYELYLLFNLREYVDQAASLVAIAEQSNTIVLAHVTVGEYLKKRTDIFLNPEVGLARTCLTYLSLDAFADNAESNVEHGANPKDCPFLQYTAENWGRHLKGEPEQMQELQC